MNRLSTLLAAPLLCLLFCSTILAQPDSDADDVTDDRPEANADDPRTSPDEAKLKEQVITATRSKTRQNLTGSTVTVIDREEIRLRDKRSVHELLRTVPGVTVTQSGGPGKVASVFLRGSNSNQTLVLVDGFRVNSTTTGGFDFADLTTDNIQRIEILRGPHSPLYGSEAIGGVINIITRQGTDEFSGHAKAEAGSHKSRHGRVSTEGGVGNADFSLSASRLVTEGISAVDPATGDGDEDGYENTTVSTRLGYTFLEDGRVDLTLRSVTGENDVDGFRDDPNAEQQRDALFLGLTVQKPITDWWNQKVRVGLQDDDLEGNDPDTPNNNFSIDSRLTSFLWQSEVQPVEWNTVTAGYEVEKRAGENRGTFDRDLYVRSVFLQNHLTLDDRFSLTLGVRNDDHDTFGAETTYRASSSLLFPETGTRLHGHYGTGFRAPTLNELFFSGPFGSGNPELDPEESKGFDVGVEQSFLDDRLTVDVTYFYNEYEDLIQFVDQGGFFFMAENVQSAKSYGYETTASAQLTDRWSFSSTFTYTDTENNDTDRPLARRPEEKYTIRTSYRIEEGFSGTLSWVQVRERFDTSGDRLDDYNRLDVSARYETPYDLAVTARVRNLLNRDYNEIAGFNSPGFNGYAGLEYSW